MKTVSLNGKWKCKADVENIGIKNKWYDPESYNKRDNHLIDIEIPKIINVKIKSLNTKIIGIILWIVLFPLSFFLITHVIDYVPKYFESKPDYLNR